VIKKEKHLDGEGVKSIYDSKLLRGGTHGDGRKIGIVVSRWNSEITYPLYDVPEFRGKRLFALKFLARSKYRWRSVHLLNAETWMAWSLSAVLSKVRLRTSNISRML
jgi:hypothetical protein